MIYFLNSIGLLILIFLNVILKNSTPTKNCICLSESNILAIGKCGEKKIKEGVWIYMFSDGKPWAIGNYNNNKMNGIWKEFYDDSLCTLRSVTFYEDDKANGIRYIYEKSGSLIEKQLCKNDKILKKIIYSNDTIYKVNFPTNASVTIPNLYNYKINNVLLVSEWYALLKIIEISIILVLFFFNILYFLKKTLADANL